MTHDGFIFICLFIAFVLTLVGFAAGVSWEGCLIYGIDFNAKNEPFGLFCN
jgi:hypothetical protein